MNPEVEALNYLQQNRGLFLATIEQFDLRYDPGFIIIPVHDPYGQELGHQTRSIEGSLKRNSLGFHSHEVLYNLHRAKRAIVEQDAVLIVEGPFDAMLAWQNGSMNVVATLGNLVGYTQALILSRYTLSAVLCLDRDEAGEVGSRRSGWLLRKLGFSVESVLPAQGKDLAESKGVSCPVLTTSRLLMF